LTKIPHCGKSIDYIINPIKLNETICEDVIRKMVLSTFLMTQDKILLDGAMGTQLALRGLSMGGHANLTDPDAVLDIHQQYSQCGNAQID
jgi:hypothetical protein